MISNVSLRLSKCLWNKVSRCKLPFFPSWNVADRMLVCSADILNNKEVLLKITLKSSSSVAHAANYSSRRGTGKALNWFFCLSAPVILHSRSCRVDGGVSRMWRSIQHHEPRARSRQFIQHRASLYNRLAARSRVNDSFVIAHMKIAFRIIFSVSSCGFQVPTFQQRFCCCRFLLKIHFSFIAFCFVS